MRISGEGRAASAGSVAGRAPEVDAAAKGWEQLAVQAAGNTRNAWIVMRGEPAPATQKPPIAEPRAPAQYARSASRRTRARPYDALAASYAKDPRCIAMAEALAPFLARNCPKDAGGYGGSYQVNLDDGEAVGLGGVKLIRAAMRKAARQLGWKVTTIGWIGTRFGIMVAVQDTRDVPDEHKAAVDAAMNDRMRAVLHKVWGEPGPAPVQRGSVVLMTQEFRAAVAKTNA